MDKIDVIMIPKLINNPQINRLRVINKFEGGFNLVFELFWPKGATHQLEKQGELNENQWRTRPRFSVDYSTLIDASISSIYWLTCKNFVKLQNDETTCFDRMILNFTVLCCRRFHVPYKLVHCKPIH